MRRLVLAAFAVVGACASAGAPPGGPEDHAPPIIVSASPDSGQTNAKVKSVEFRFNEVINDRVAAGSAGLGQYFLISPRNGATLADWHRSRITVRPQRGFRENTAYRVTVLPGLSDLRGNIRRETKSILFSTGGGFPPLGIPGRVFDWGAQRPAPNAYVEAAMKSDTSVVYLAIADTSGQFEIGPLPPGLYTVRAVIDQNSNRVPDRNEKWDSLTVNVVDTRRLIELDAIERDTVPANIDAVVPIDSVSIRVSFDKYLDPALTLQPALVRMQRADSTQLEVERVEWGAPFTRAKQARDSARRADSLAAIRPPAAAPGQPAPAPAQPTPPVLTPGGAG
ncbi:MAG TPA: Ig-like domain-containing protein, partial [Gemmatimonadaceae bacterium]